jgi:hypothetical protein
VRHIARARSSGASLTLLALSVGTDRSTQHGVDVRLLILAQKLFIDVFGLCRVVICPRIHATSDLRHSLTHWTSMPTKLHLDSSLQVIPSVFKDKLRG